MENATSFIIRFWLVISAPFGTLRINSPFLISRTAAKPLLHQFKKSFIPHQLHTRKSKNKKKRIVINTYPPALGKLATQRVFPKHESDWVIQVEGESDIPSSAAHFRKLFRFNSSASSMAAFRWNWVFFPFLLLEKILMAQLDYCFIYWANSA